MRKVILSAPPLWTHRYSYRLVVALFLTLAFCGIACASVSGESKLENHFLYIAYHKKRIDLGDIKFVKDFANECRFSDEGRLSAKALNALGVILLHSGEFPDFQDRCISSIYERIGIDVDALAFAHLSDLISIARGEPQEYGSIGTLVIGKLRYVGSGFVATNRDDIGLTAISSRPEEMLLRPPVRPMGGSSFGISLAMSAPVYPLNPALRSLIMAMVQRDQSARSPDAMRMAGSKGRNEVDAKNVSELRAIFKHYGIPGVSEIGRNGVRSFFLLVQHAVSDVELMRRVLASASPLLRSGALPKVYFALLTDRCLILAHKPQLYGSQFGNDAEGHFTYPITDPEGVNKRRAQMYMAPLKQASIERQRWPIARGSSSMSP